MKVILGKNPVIQNRWKTGRTEYKFEDKKYVIAVKELPKGYRLAEKKDIGKNCMFLNDMGQWQCNGEVGLSGVEIVKDIKESRNYNLNKTVNITTDEFEQRLGELCDEFSVNIETETFEHKE